MDTSVKPEDSEPEDDNDGDDDEGFEVEIDTDDPDEPTRDWVRTITTLLAQRSQEKDPSDRVQFAMDMMFVAACERLTRLLHSDLELTDQASSTSA